METNNNIPELIVKYLEGTLNNNEKLQLDQWVNESAENQQLFKHLTDPPSEEELAQINETDDEANWKIIKQMYPDETKPVRFHWERYAAAAIILLALSLVTYHYFRPAAGTRVASVTKHADSSRNSTSYFLKRYDGTIIQLDKVKNGVIAKDSNWEIVKVSEGKIEYHSIRSRQTNMETMQLQSPEYNKQATQLQYDSIITPMGGSYTAVLPDGTKVTIKPGSFVCFPTTILPLGRTIAMAGEAYFEASKIFSANGHKIPLTVIAGEMQVQVTGTHFNVMAYDNESNKNVTLEEGSVTVTTPHSTVELKPGQQAQLDHAGQLHLSQVDMKTAMAWKNDQIIFNGAPLDSMMRVVKRYYNVDFECTRSCSDRYHGILMLNEPLSTFLKGLNNTGEIKLEIKGQKIIAR